MFSKALKFLLDKAVLPAAFVAAGTAIPVFGFLMSIPIIGPAIRAGIQHILDDLYDKGMIAVKINLLDHLDAKAKAEYAPEIKILQDAQAQDSLTPEQEKEYNEKLNNLLRSRPGIVDG